ncbi:phosphatase [Lactococcus cremoris]|uniref:HAD-IA family hydrolase n=1 Tax=Lactococcus lactis subsp. cremoris TaxID=1359 RepID=A0A1V0PIP8_LACLC|nr:HAD-IA family hydrolase [Lactococcus cremoris]ARE29049.1 HAD-IA family hydrolase [Lactococcus cremoris]EUN34741.1 HAD superfamily hydrolase [Lactococcus cremoris subsp. cremoris HP]KZK12785.1 hydrolase haloacid dehalogenase-like family [Lactococcus cremoris]KZK34949.1 hydrolase haloacid dehalogenase-like family [Lactococcus cremoris]KZK43033.1 hydrolase haloacid dehalogenase-like family [Lactococcus cremoris]
MTTFIWDLDGTLIDSYDVFLEALSESFANFKLPFDRQTVYNFIKEESVNSLLEKQAVSFEKIKEDFTNNSTSKNYKIKLMVGAKEVLDWTQKENIQNFIYTHKGKNSFDLLKQLGISSYFLEVVTSENNFKRKPNPEAINYLVKKYNLKTDETYNIGDRKLDIEAAHNSGLGSINFLSSANSQEIKKLTDIIKIFERK